MSNSPKRHKGLVVGAVIVVVGVGGYLFYRHSKTTAAINSSGQPSQDLTTTSNAANLQVLYPGDQGGNAQGNYGDTSNSYYMLALAAEARLDKALAAKEKRENKNNLKKVKITKVQG